MAPTSVSFTAVSLGQLEHQPSDAPGGVGPGKTLRRLAHSLQASLVVQELAHERKKLLDISLLEHDSRTVALEVARVGSLMAAGVAVGHEDRRKAHRR